MENRYTNLFFISVIDLKLSQIFSTVMFSKKSTNRSH